MCDEGLVQIVQGKSLTDSSPGRREPQQPAFPRIQLIRASPGGWDRLSCLQEDEEEPHAAAFATVATHPARRWPCAREGPTTSLSRSY